MLRGGEGILGMGRTALAEENFFSVLRTAPERWAAFKADLPLMTVSRSPLPPPLAFLPILVTVSHSSLALILTVDFLALVCCKVVCLCSRRSVVGPIERLLACEVLIGVL